MCVLTGYAHFRHLRYPISIMERLFPERGRGQGFKRWSGSCLKFETRQARFARGSCTSLTCKRALYVSDEREEFEESEVVTDERAFEASVLVGLSDVMTLLQEALDALGGGAPLEGELQGLVFMAIRKSLVLLSATDRLLVFAGLAVVAGGGTKPGTPPPLPLRARGVTSSKGSPPLGGSYVASSGKPLKKI